MTRITLSRAMMRILGSKALSMRRLALPGPKKMAGSEPSSMKCFSVMKRVVKKGRLADLALQWLQN